MQAQFSSPVSGGGGCLVSAHQWGGVSLPPRPSPSSHSNMQMYMMSFLLATERKRERTS